MNSSKQTCEDATIFSFANSERSNSISTITVLGSGDNESTQVQETQEPEPRGGKKQ